jgi:type IV fimbrial biogenesis protein FimT
MFKKNFVKPNTQGFTLVELMITLVIFGILVSMAIPSFTQMIRDNSILAATNDLHASLELARSESVTREANISLTSIAGSWSNGWEVFVDSNADNVKDDGELVINNYAVSNASLVINIKGNVDKIRYTQTGRSALAHDDTKDFFEITLVDAKKRCVFFTVTGRPFTKESGEGNCP